MKPDQGWVACQVPLRRGLRTKNALVVGAEVPPWSDSNAAWLVFGWPVVGVPVQTPHEVPDSSDVPPSLSKPGTIEGIEGNDQVIMIPGPEGLVVQATGDDPNLILPAFPYDPKTTLVVRVDLTCPAATHLDIYYQTSQALAYAETRKLSHSLNQGRNVLYIPVLEPDLAGRLRLDPGTVPGEYVLHAVEVRRAAERP